MTQIVERRERTIVATIKLTLILVLAAGLFVVSANCTSQRRSLGRDIADLIVVRNDLQATADRLEQGRVQGRADLLEPYGENGYRLRKIDGDD